ncbi:MAG: pyridoxal phosphate-dependent aminotransferase [Candidatus Krumholzibacteriota bacterium]|nr:pyridoxal phosphate-dependent aminotransferase [Candidatus Krumholzibacteriota bacterium]
MPTNTKPRLSARGRAVPASPIRRLVPYADAAKADGVAILHLNIGQPDIPTPRAMIEAYRSYDEKVLAYGHSAGLPIFRRAVADYWKRWNVDLAPEQVITTTGGSEAILFTLYALTDPGDEILVPEPFYTNYLGFATAAAVTVVPVPARVDDGFRLPPTAVFEALITPRTRAILFSNPGNPTGVVYTRAEMERLAELARARDLFLLADEVYREFVYDGAEYTSVLHLPGLEERAVVLDSISKRYSACGARVGNIATRNEDLLEAALRFGQARLCPPTVDQLAGAAAYASPASYLEDVRVEYQQRRDILFAALKAIPGVTTFRPAGAFYTVARLPVADAERFAIWLLTDFRVDGRSVMVAPASGFYATPGRGLDEVRIAYVLKGEDLKEAVAILAAGLAAYPG